MSEKPKTKTVELVRTDYQPTKREKEEAIQSDASFEEIADALLTPVNIRWIARPSEPASQAVISGVLYIIPFHLP